jgi:cyclo(L-tyrosyl-L-tyrosyl) synthase
LRNGNGTQGKIKAMFGNVVPVIGMSPGNSYFKDDVVDKLLKKVVEKYGRAVVLVADIPAISTYVALGYPKNRARRDKALPQGNALKNKVFRTMDKFGYSTEQVKIIDWEGEIENNLTYQEKFKKVSDLYELNSPFRDEADSTTAKVLEYSRSNNQDMNGAVKVAVHYLLAELAFMEFAPEYLKAKSCIYVYHKNWPIYEDYIAGKFDGKSRPYLGFALIGTG